MLDLEFLFAFHIELNLLVYLLVIELLYLEVRRVFFVHLLLRAVFLLVSLILFEGTALGSMLSMLFPVTFRR